MNIILHGAIDNSSSNFGDFIYANEMYNWCKLESQHPYFYRPSTFVEKYTLNYEKNSFNGTGDLLLYIPGGYFIGDRKGTLINSYKRIKRYFLIGIKYLLLNKKVAIVSVDGGDIRNRILKCVISLISKRASLITVRNKESEYFFFQEYNIRARNYGDIILGFDLKSKIQFTDQLSQIRAQKKDKKMLLVHYNSEENAMVKFSDCIKQLKWLMNDYLIVVTSDSINSTDEALFRKFKQQLCNDVLLFRYENPFELIGLIDMSDTILTCKLHLGVVGCMFEKSVVCVAKHYEKTRRFYSYIDEENRCIPLDESSIDDIVTLLESNIDERVVINEELINKAKLHFKQLQEKVLLYE